MTVLSENDPVEGVNQNPLSQNLGKMIGQFLAASDAQCTSLNEVVLHINDDECGSLVLRGIGLVCAHFLLFLLYMVWLFLCL